MASLFSSTRAIFSAAIALRIALLLYGQFQDAHSPMKYTDIDYFVFTDAARFVSRGQSPYDRDTYRYTPMLAWLLLPTTWRPWSFSFGKVLFAVGDIVAGWLMLRVLRSAEGGSLSQERALRFAAIWLLNPMVATISTRGSSEGLLCVLVVALLWAVLQRRIVLAGVLLGLAVHFKIYPFIYGVSILRWLDADTVFSKKKKKEEENVSSSPSSIDASFFSSLWNKALAFFNLVRISLIATSLTSFLVLNGIMYGQPFIQHTFLYHVTRIDHRHNFSPYNTLLHLNSSPAASPSALRLESLAFIPQLLLSTVAIPLILSKRDLASTMLAQTFAFVTFNKVCTSQYFLWYMVFLPFYLPHSSLLARPRLGLSAAALWLLAQAVWLQQGYQLEFLGQSTFAPGLWMAGTAFFLVNVWILGVIVSDVGRMRRPNPASSPADTVRSVKVQHKLA
ncbi:MAG: GPI mannosyltransferase 1 [Sarcosagium campestre]|nr:MAG: GPI mannosyltransferase 1 [Sarcosagium campestre]